MDGALEHNPQYFERLVAATTATAMVGGAGVVAFFDPTKAGFFPVCPLYSVTGLACPGCGLTRGFHALFHGDVLTALDYNALLPIFGLVLAYAFIQLVYYAWRGRALPVKLNHPKVYWVALTLLLVFGVTRNLPWWPFSVLFP
jgi:Protein of unknown function (DUF2752)